MEARRASILDEAGRCADLAARVEERRPEETRDEDHLFFLRVWIQSCEFVWWGAMRAAG